MGFFRRFCMGSILVYILFSSDSFLPPGLLDVLISSDFFIILVGMIQAHIVLIFVESY